MDKSLTESEREVVESQRSLERASAGTTDRWAAKEAWKNQPGNRYTPEEIRKGNLLSATLDLDTTFDVVLSL